MRNTALITLIASAAAGFVAARFAKASAPAFPAPSIQPLPAPVPARAPARHIPNRM